MRAVPNILASTETEALSPAAQFRRELGARIRACRERQGLTQEALAKSVGKTRVAITQWESGLSAPFIDIIPALASILQVTKAYLAFGDGEPSGLELTTVSVVEFHSGECRTVGEMRLPTCTLAAANLAPDAVVKAFVLPDWTIVEGLSSGDIIFIDEASKNIEGKGEHYLSIDPPAHLSVFQAAAIPGSPLIQIKFSGQTAQVERRSLRPYGRIVGRLKVASPAPRSG